jgi:predicted acyltransferase
MTTPAYSPRLFSLDAFRGATIAAMILVNNPGSWSAVYPQLRHAEWNGWTMTDWIFPFFLFIVGVAMTFSFAKRKDCGATIPQLYRHILVRTAGIFAIGLFLNGFPNFDLPTLRIPGVLQRIALCYGIASVIFLKTTIRGQIFWITGLLICYWLMMQYIPVPGVGTGVYEPGKNFSNYIDMLLLSGHMWRETLTWDPEGIVSTIPSIATILFGVITGHLLRSEKSKDEKTVWMFIAGIFLLFLGTILDMWLPINKKIWTSSYCIFMAGWANISLAVCYWFIDVKGYSRWAKPFIIYGMNAIAVYVAADIMATILDIISVTDRTGASLSLKEYFYTNVLLPVANPTNASLLFAITFVLVMYLFVWGLWKRKWFLKV